MDGQIIKDKSLHKFDQEASNYESTMDGKFCARAYTTILDTIENLQITSLLDVGCGTGIILSKIHERNKKLSLYGIDLSPNMIEQTEKRLAGHVKCIVGDAEALPYEVASFDAVLCSFSFHHYPHPEKVLSEMNRILKPSGKLIIVDPWMPTPFRQIFNTAIIYSKSGDFHSYSKGEITKMLQKSGFQTSQFSHPTHDTFLLVGEKQ